MKINKMLDMLTKGFTYFAVLSLLITFAGCNNNPGGDLGDSAEETSLSGPDSSWLAAYFLLDHNWTNPENTDTIDRWIPTKIEEAKAEKAVSIFGHSGAGPHGAQWNPETDLLCVGHQTLEPGTSVEGIQVYLNDEKVDIEVNRMTDVANSIYFHFRLKRDLWQSASREMVEDDLEHFYADAPKSLDQWNRFLETGDSTIIGIPPLVGELTKVAVKLTLSNNETRELSGILHAVYAE